MKIMVWLFFRYFEKKAPIEIFFCSMGAFFSGVVFDATKSIKHT